MAHYKENTNKNNFIPQKNTKKKKKFTKSQLIVFILMIFWSICSILGSLGFAFSVAKADTLTEEEQKQQRLDLVYSNLNIVDSTFNLLYMYPMLNSILSFDSENPDFTSNNPCYKIYKANDNSLNYTGWFEIPFVMPSGPYTFCLDDFVASSLHSRLQLQIQSSNGVNRYINIDNSSSTAKDMIINFYSTINIKRMRFLFASSYSGNVQFTFQSPRLFYGQGSVFPYAQPIVEVVNYVFNEGYDDGYGYAYHLIDQISYDKGYADATVDFDNKYGSAIGGIFANATFECDLFASSVGVTVSSTDPKPDFVGNDTLDWSRLLNGTLTNTVSGEVADVTKISITITFDSPIYYYSNMFYGRPYIDKVISVYSSDGSGATLKNYSTHYGEPIYGPAIGDLLGYGVLYPEPYYDSLLYPSFPISKIMFTFEDSEEPVLYYPKGFNNYSFDLGFEQGFSSAISTEEYVNALNQAREEGRIKGYNQGVESANQYTFLGLMSAVIESPINAVVDLFDFELLGFNMKSIYLSILTCSILIFIIKRIV